MPGDPAVVEEAENVPLLSPPPTFLLPFLSRFLPSGLRTSKPGFFSPNHSSALKELPAARPSLTILSQPDTVKALDLIRAPSAMDLKEWLLRMYALTDYALFEAISSLPLSSYM